MGDSKLSFKIAAVDSTKNAVNSSKENLKRLRKEISDLFKESKKTEEPFHGIEKQLKNVSKASEDLADVFKNVNKEDEAIAAKMKEKGKELQQIMQKPKKEKDLRTLSTEKGIQTALQQATTQATTVKEVKVDRMSVRRYAEEGIAGMGKVGGRKGTTTTEKGAGGQDLSSTLMGIGGKGGVISGIIMAAIGTTYGLMAAKGGAFRGAAGAQRQALQQLGFGALPTTVEGMMVGGKKVNVGGLYSGYKGQFGGVPTYLTGQQQTTMMQAFAQQTGAGRGRLETMMYGRGGGIPIAALAQAYGMAPEQLAGTAGLFERFGMGRRGTKGVEQTMSMAERVGMGGARMQEFIDAMQEALTQAVYDGTYRTQASLLKGLGTLMDTNDERLKALAPEIMRTSSQKMQQAAMLGGGVESNFMLQAVINQRRQVGAGGGIFDVMEQLASGDWLKNAQAALIEAGRRSGGNKQWEAFTFTRAMGLNIASPKMQQELAKMVRKGITPEGKKLTGETFQQEVQKRLKATSEIIDKTSRMDYVESIHTLSEANKDAAKGLIELKERVFDLSDAMYTSAKKIGKSVSQERETPGGFSRMFSTKPTRKEHR
jgi:hypothetical protein